MAGTNLISRRLLQLKFNFPRSGELYLGKSVSDSLVETFAVIANLDLIGV